MAESLAGTGGGEAEGETPLPDDGGRTAKGVWPPWWKKFGTDFQRAKNAKSNDGLQAPALTDLEWASSRGAGTPEILEAARRRHEQAEARIEKAEARAERLVQRGLSLIAIDFLLVGYLANRFQAREYALGWWCVGLAFPIAALAMLGLCVIQAIGVDRVGFVEPADPGRAAVLPSRNQVRNLVLQEAEAAQTANWTARHKLNEVLQARAWFSRGFAALVLSGLVLVFVWSVGNSQTTTKTKASPRPSTTTTVTSTTTTATTTASSTTAPITSSSAPSSQVPTTR